MPIEYIIIANKQGQTRLSRYTHFRDVSERAALEGAVVRKCLQRKERECSFLEHGGVKVIFRRYASLFFIVGVVGGSENELGVFEFIHCLVEALDEYFVDVCELDVMYGIDKAHFIIEEMVMNGMVVETNKALVLQPLRLMDGKAK